MGVRLTRVARLSLPLAVALAEEVVTQIVALAASVTGIGCAVVLI